MFYLYPFESLPRRFRWEYDKFFFDRWCCEAIDALLNHHHRTDCPDKADLFIVTSTLQCVSFVKIESDPLKELLSRLKYRDGRIPHVVFDFTDQPYPLFSGDDLLVCKSAFHEKFFNSTRAVSVPQFPRYRFVRELLPASKRRYVASFKGNPRTQFGSLRTRLLALNDESSIVVKAGVFMPSDLRILSSGEVQEIVKPDEVSYVELLFESTFALLPRANGYALSYRMIEAMNAGCIPVIISDGYVLPFVDIIDYSSCSIRIRESDVEMLPEILARHQSEADVLQAAVINVFRKHFSSTQSIIGTLIECCMQRTNIGL